MLKLWWKLWLKSKSKVQTGSPCEELGSPLRPHLSSEFITSLSLTLQTNTNQSQSVLIYVCRFNANCEFKWGHTLVGVSCTIMCPEITCRALQCEGHWSQDKNSFHIVSKAWLSDMSPNIIYSHTSATARELLSYFVKFLCWPQVNSKWFKIAFCQKKTIKKESRQTHGMTDQNILYLGKFYLCLFTETTRIIIIFLCLLCKLLAVLMTRHAWQWLSCQSMLTHDFHLNTLKFFF